MADNRLIYQLTDGTPANTDVVPYSGPASGDAFKATVQELWAAGMQPQSNATIGTFNQVIAGPSSTAAEGYCIGNNNALAGCAYAIGDQNRACGTIDPCSFSYGYAEQAYAGAYSYGTNNQTVGTVSAVDVNGAPSFTVGRDNVVTGTNNHCDGYNCRIGGGPFALTNTGGNNYSSTLNITSYFVGGYVVLTYLVTGSISSVRVAERLAYSNVTWDGTNTTFQLASKSMTPDATPTYYMYTNDSTETFVYGYGNNVYNSASTFVLGRGTTIQNGSLNTMVGYNFTNANIPGGLRTNCTYVGGNCSLDLCASGFVYTTGMSAITPAQKTTSFTVDGNGNLSFVDASAQGSLFVINQLTAIQINSISTLATQNTIANGQQFRLVNIGTSDITLSKDNASGTSGYRLMWQKAGGSITLGQNHSVVLLYLNNLPMSGSTGGWLVLTDGIG